MPEALEVTKRLVTEAGGSAEVVLADVSEEDHVQAVLAPAEQRVGGCDAVLHGAAACGTPTRLVGVRLTEREHVMATNLRSTFVVSVLPCVLSSARPRLDRAGVERRRDDLNANRAFCDGGGGADGRDQAMP